MGARRCHLHYCNKRYWSLKRIISHFPKDYWVLYFPRIIESCFPKYFCQFSELVRVRLAVSTTALTVSTMLLGKAGVPCPLQILCCLHFVIFSFIFITFLVGVKLISVPERRIPFCATTADLLTGYSGIYDLLDHLVPIILYTLSINSSARYELNSFWIFFIYVDCL